MKNRLFSLLFAGIMGVLAVHAQTDYAKLGIERKLLFTMNKNEVCTEVEVYNPSNGVNNIKSEMYVKDTLSNISTYVFNGERAVSSVSIIIPAHEIMENAPVRDSLILRYEQKDGCYIRFGKKSYGPYKKVYPQGWNRFIYVSKGDYYMHDADGMTYKIVDGKQGRKSFKSPNKKHTAQVSSNNIYKIRVDNTLYTLDSIKYTPYRDDITWMKDARDSYENKNIADVYVFDDGSCIVSYGQYDKFEATDEIDDNYESHNSVDVGLTYDEFNFVDLKTYYIKNGKVQVLSKYEYFDRIMQKIMKYDIVPSRYHFYSYHISSDDGISSASTNLEDEKEYIKMVDNVLVEIGFNIWDENRAHHFMTAKGWGYIYIDDKAIKSNYPIWAFRNTYVNAFHWVVVEGNEVVYYSYQLP